jgi:hypothetical protein
VEVGGFARNFFRGGAGITRTFACNLNCSRIFSKLVAFKIDYEFPSFFQFSIFEKSGSVAGHVWSDSCPHGMARPQVADVGTASGYGL